MAHPSPSLPMAPPKEWPKEVCELYEPIRVLGKGGFAYVILARKKKKTTTTTTTTTNPTTTLTQELSKTNNNNNNNNSNNKEMIPTTLVAIKMVGLDHATKSEVAYAHREVDILRAIDHPNIMKVMQYFQPSHDHHHLSANVICLTYHKGPTVQALLEYGGALSILFGRVVISQLVDAVAYLHSHAIVHRDLKPDNLIVTGASSQDDGVWDDENNNYPVEPPWNSLREKWHLTLIDFGFARALTPQDVCKPSLEYRRENLNASFHGNKVVIMDDRSQQGVNSRRSMDSSGNGLSSGSSSIRRKISFRQYSSNLDGSGHNNSSSTHGRRLSISHMLKRQMSALGNRNFAAPEILHVQREQHHEEPEKVTDTISEYVAEYGLLVDAYSLGFTIRYMMTGVPPNQRVEDAIAKQNSLRKRMGRWIGKKLHNEKQKSNAPKKRRKKYRLVQDLPGELQRLIQNLTEKAERNRTSVRAARRYHWINDCLPESNLNNSSTCDIQYLHFLDKDDNPVGVVVTSDNKQVVGSSSSGIKKNAVAMIESPKEQAVLYS